MISKAKSKYIKSLQVKKYRLQEQCFLAEGAKSVEELLQSDFETVMVVATREYLANAAVPIPAGLELIEATVDELTAVSSLQTNDAVLAVARMKPNQPFIVGPDEYALVLDDIRDPGNLGTIIRTADWYGITKIVASEETADLYNAKTIVATMGSFCRVRVFYTNLVEYVGKTNLPTYGTFLNGKSVHHFDFAPGGLIVVGNESKGISMEVAAEITHRITIPKYGGAESLNAGIATAIVLDNLLRTKGG